MKYFIEGLDNEEWMENLKEYWKEFDKIKGKLSPVLVDVFRTMHDSEILSICFVKNEWKGKRCYDLNVQVENDKFRGSIIHRNIEKCTGQYIDMYSVSKKYKYTCEYLYGEILTKQKLWFHDFTYAPEGEFSIVCHEIKWVSDQKK